MRYIPSDRKARERMMEDVGCPAGEDLFAVIPPDLRLSSPLSLPAPMEEPALARLMAAMAAENEGADRRTCILGGGAYHHYLPAAVRHLVSRAEFYTAYTPYQPEISQGTLQAMFEYQSMICALTGMDVSNASMYDGASAAAEAILMAVRLTGRSKAVVSRAVNPFYREVIASYLRHAGVETVEAACDLQGRTDYGHAARLRGPDTACVVVQNPNFFGVIEDPQRLRELRGGSDALLVAVVAEAVSLGLLSPPGEWGADIVAAEGQSLGNPLGFGGPYLGILAAREAGLRQMPGRLVGRTTDGRGERGFVLTLSTREQHIRRERATSNICSNEALCALAAAVHLSLLGPSGLREVAGRNVLAARKAMEGLAKIGDWSFPFSGPVFNEFVAVPRMGAGKVQDLLRIGGFSGGLAIGRWYPEVPEAILFCFTEMVSDEEIERFLVEAAGGAP